MPPPPSLHPLLLLFAKRKRPQRGVPEGIAYQSRTPLQKPNRCITAPSFIPRRVGSPAAKPPTRVQDLWLCVAVSRQPCPFQKPPLLGQSQHSMDHDGCQQLWRYRIRGIHRKSDAIGLFSCGGLHHVGAQPSDKGTRCTPIEGLAALGLDRYWDSGGGCVQSAAPGHGGSDPRRPLDDVTCRQDTRPRSNLPLTPYVYSVRSSNKGLGGRTTCRKRPSQPTKSW